MPILTTLHRVDGIDIHGKTLHRIAVRAVIQRGENLLMIFSANVGDYKFPGGGVQADETHEQALRREVREECGAELSHFGEEIGSVVEYNHAKDAGFETFKMTSHYYRCEVMDGFGAQTLDGYERDLGFTPVWIAIDDAIRINKSLRALPNASGWFRRETFVLEYLRNN